MFREAAIDEVEVVIGGLQVAVNDALASPALAVTLIDGAEEVGGCLRTAKTSFVDHPLPQRRVRRREGGAAGLVVPFFLHASYAGAH